MDVPAHPAPNTLTMLHDRWRKYPIRWQTLCCIVAAILLSACAHRQPLQIDGFTMGSQYHITVIDIPHGVDRAALEKAIRDQLDSLYHTVSTFLPDSELSRLNKAPSGQWIDISPTLYQLLSQSLQLSQLTQGCFDITVGALVNLWGFGPTFTDNQIPDAALVAQARLQIGFQDIELRMAPYAVKKHKAPQLDLSAIDQGFAADQIADYLNGVGIHDYLIDIAGEFKASGNGPRGSGWRVGIEQPLAATQTRSMLQVEGQARNAIDEVLLLQQAALATSGGYRNFFEKNGNRYSHTIDPATGNPVVHALVAVTVIHSSATTADAIATALMVMGPERGRQFTQRHGIAARFVVQQEGGVQHFFTGGFERYLENSTAIAH